MTESSAPKPTIGTKRTKADSPSPTRSTIETDQAKRTKTEPRFVKFQSITMPEMWIATYFVPEDRVGEILTPEEIKAWREQDCCCDDSLEKLENATDGVYKVHHEEGMFNVAIPDGGVITAEHVHTYSTM
jgi:hypothetical protein